MEANPFLDSRSSLHPALSVRQALALQEEADSVRNLMRSSIEAIRGMRRVDVEGDSVFTLGSIGAEKAMKLILGCKAIDEAGSWPTKCEMKRWGHDTEQLNKLLLTAVAEGIERTTADEYSARLAEHLRGNTVVPLAFATFARYGTSGRFHQLDILATDQPGDLDRPSDYWERVESHVRKTRPEFRVMPSGDNAALDDHVKRLRGFIAGELDAWWFCIHRLSVQGCFGELAKGIGWQIWDHERPVPSTVKA